jgi:Ulp1 family protease
MYGPDLTILDHFILGIIDLDSKQITILDLMSMTRNKGDYGIAFLALLEINNLIHICGSMHFDSSKFNWKLVVSDDSAQQEDGINCGVFMILNVAAVCWSKTLRH